MIDKTRFLSLPNLMQNFKLEVFEILAIFKWWKLWPKPFYKVLQTGRVSRHYLTLLCPAFQTSVSSRQKGIFVGTVQQLKIIGQYSLQALKMIILLNVVPYLKSWNFLSILNQSSKRQRLFWLSEIIFIIEIHEERIFCAVALYDDTND